MCMYVRMYLYVCIYTGTCTFRRKYLCPYALSTPILKALSVVSVTNPLDEHVTEPVSH